MSGGGSELTPEDVKEILRLVDESELDEFELETPRLSIRYRRATETRESRSATEEPSNRLLLGEQEVGPEGLVEVTAPMVGTFYRSPAPGKPPFVEIGSEVAEDTQVCVLEVMKLMHSVAAGVAGVVAEICCEDAAPVQFGDVLLRVRPS